MAFRVTPAAYWAFATVLLSRLEKPVLYQQIFKMLPFPCVPLAFLDTQDAISPQLRLAADRRTQIKPCQTTTASEVS